MKEIVENNKLIAEFMGWKQVLTYNGYAWDMPNVDKSQKSLFGDLVDTKENGKYHSSWDWLMPVVDKCTQIGFRDTDFDSDVYLKWEELFDDMGMFLGNHIKEVYETTVEFIKWYNKQTYKIWNRKV